MLGEINQVIDWLKLYDCKVAPQYFYDSVVTLAFGFVTFTPNCFAFAMISTRFLDDTACPILFTINTRILTGVAPDMGDSKHTRLQRSYCAVECKLAGKHVGFSKYKPSGVDHSLRDLISTISVYVL